MTLYTLSIRRPVLAIVMSMTIVLFGVIGFTFLGVREFPSLDPPNITVSTYYRGASADVIESQITEPLEESVNGVDGIRTLTSTSRDGRSTVQAEFDLGTDLETGRQRRSRPRVPGHAEPAAGRRSADGLEGRCRRAADRADHHEQRPAQSARAQPHRRRGVRGTSADHSQCGQRRTSGARSPTPCACGSIPTSSPPSACLRSTFGMRWRGRMSSCRRDGSKDRRSSFRCER